MKKLLGVLLLALPFMGVFVVLISIIGLPATFVVLVLTIIVTACIVVGTTLLGI